MIFSSASFFRYCLFFLLIINLPAFSCQAVAQGVITKNTATGKSKRLYERGRTYSRNGLLDKAIADFEKAISITPGFIDAHYELAAVYFNQKKYPEAQQYLQKVITLKADELPKAHYYLGITLLEQQLYAEAETAFSDFFKFYEKEGKLTQQAKKHLQNAQFAAEAIKNPIPFDPKPLPELINTSFPEYLPSVTADGNLLVFTRRINGDEEVFVSEKKEGKWQKPQPLTDINTRANEGSQYISADGSTLVFVRCSDRTGYGGCDLYFSEKKDGRWTKPENMGQPINTRAWESQPSLSADGKTLYFASSRKGTIGGRDLWRTWRQPDGTWANPKNLGTNINTPDDDEAPFLHPDGKTLYFMSEGHPGMGGYDLFVARRDTNQWWGQPQNMGYPVNTTGNEGALFITLDGTTAYFAKDELPEDDLEKLTARRQPDIFTFELEESLRPTPVTYIKAVVKNAESGATVSGAEVNVVNLSTGQSITRSTTNWEGSFLACLPMGDNYALNVGKEGFLFYSENFQLTKITNRTEPFLLQINLQPIPQKEPAATQPVSSKPIILKNVFFASGSSELLSQSEVELQRLYQLLEDHPEMYIQINGHTDNVGSEEDNLLLSEQRARAVADFLQNSGIDSARISYKGYGEQQPIDTNDTEQGRANNRRTEFVVVR